MPFRSLVAAAVAADSLLAVLDADILLAEFFLLRARRWAVGECFRPVRFRAFASVEGERRSEGSESESACSDHQRAAWRAMTPVRATEQTRWAEARLRTSKRREGGRGAEEGTGTCTEENVSSNVGMTL